MPNIDISKTFIQDISKTFIHNKGKTKDGIIMKTLHNYVKEYLEYCECRKRLNKKTLKAYKIDLKQYEEFSVSKNYFSKDVIDTFITTLHKQYKPKTIK